MTQDNGDTGRDVARIAIFAALIAALGFIAPIPLAGGVPITVQTLGVMLAGAILGWRKAPLAVVLVLVLVAVGLPLLSGGRGGHGVFVAPSAGYLIGWIPGAMVVGLIVHGGKITWWRTALGVVIGGILVVYLVGIPVQALILGWELGVTALSALVFLPGDLIKAAAAVVLTLAVHRAYPRAFGLRPAVRIEARAQARVG